MPHLPRLTFVSLAAVLCLAWRADLGPVYEMVFGRLKGHHLDWRYQRMHLFDFSTTRNDRERQETEEMRAAIERANREQLSALKHQPALRVVRAYCDAYGRWPQGWPHGTTARMHSSRKGEAAKHPPGPPAWRPSRHPLLPRER